MNTLEAIKARRSVRTYSGKELSDTHKSDIENELKKLTALHGVKLALIENNFGGKQFGTYGLIKNPSAYIVCVCKNDNPTIIQAGMALEKAILVCTTLGIGTCWLGGTFKRSEFGLSLTIADGEAIPAVISVGYPAKKEGVIGSLMRMGAKSNSRKPFYELFFEGDFTHPIKQNDSMTELEMVRIGPSASNKQPWRILREDDIYHFFLEHTPAYSSRYSFDMQLLDIGIAMSHFEFAMEVAGINGEWQILHKNFDALSQNTEYIISWVPSKTGETN